MRRRQFIAGLSSVAAWPVLADAQSRSMVGFLSSGSEDNIIKPLLASFHQGLGELGFVEGRNLLIQYRWANYQYDQIPALARDLIKQRVDVIAVTPPVVTALAAKAETQAIPIVFITGTDPVSAGLVSSINDPGGNLTGVAMFNAMLGMKNLELARALMPNANAIGVLVNPDSPRSRDTTSLQTDARSLGQQLHILPVHREADIGSAFDAIAERKIEALFISSDGFFFSRREELIARATKLRVPVIAFARELAWAGALISYGTSTSDGYHTCGVYVARILKGIKPSELPVVQATKFELVINLKSAKALGIEVPPSLLARADEVIE